MPMMDVEEIAAEIEEMVAEIEDIAVDEPESTEEVVEEVEPTEEIEEAEEKPTKQQEKKQEKAKEIIENFASNYDAVAQITTLALVNALGPNIKTYSNQVVQPALQWYKTEEIYTNVVMEDPLGNYLGVRDSLVFEKFIGAQYE
jgi:CHASE3 domain sensor protein